MGGRSEEVVPTVFVVGDRNTCTALCETLTGAGLSLETYESVAQLIEAYRPDQPGCLILVPAATIDDTLAALTRLTTAGLTVPVIIVTSSGDVRGAVRAVKAGVTDFLVKPVADSEVLEAVRAALALDASRRRQRPERTAFAQRLQRLTPRERQVMELMVRGLANKQIAAELGVSEHTVMTHRKRVMRKLHVQSAVELVRTVLLNAPSLLDG